MARSQTALALCFWPSRWRRAGAAGRRPEEATGISYITPFPPGDTYVLQAYGDPSPKACWAASPNSLAGDTRLQMCETASLALRPRAHRPRRRAEGRGSTSPRRRAHRRRHDRLSATASTSGCRPPDRPRRWARRMARGIRPARRPPDQDAEAAGRRAVLGRPADHAPHRGQRSRADDERHRPREGLPQRRQVHRHPGPVRRRGRQLHRLRPRYRPASSACCARPTASSSRRPAIASWRTSSSRRSSATSPRRATSGPFRWPAPRTSRSASSLSARAPPPTATAAGRAPSTPSRTPRPAVNRRAGPPAVQTRPIRSRRPTTAASPSRASAPAAARNR